MRTVEREADAAERAPARAVDGGAAGRAAALPLGGEGAIRCSPHFLVMLFSDGGWDPTQTLDVHDPLDTTDGIDVDVPGSSRGCRRRRSRPSAASPTCRTRPRVPRSTRSSSTWARADVRRERHRHALDVARPEPAARADRLPRPDARRLRGHRRAPQRRRTCRCRTCCFGAELRRAVRRALAAASAGRCRPGARLQPHPRTSGHARRVGAGRGLRPAGARVGAPACRRRRATRSAASSPRSTTPTAAADQLARLAGSLHAEHRQRRRSSRRRSATPSGPASRPACRSKPVRRLRHARRQHATRTGAGIASSRSWTRS